MIKQNSDVDSLLKARADIDEQLRLHKNAMTVLFTDVVGSTSYFEKNGDTAGLAMIHRHDELTHKIVQEYKGRAVKTIGDSVMAEFPDSVSATRAAIEIERQFLKLNSTLQPNRRVQIRIGIHTGVGFRKGDDLFGDVVNVAARVTKRAGPAQILVSQAVYDSIPKTSDVNLQWLNKFTLDGRMEKEDIFEVVWVDADAYREVRDRVSTPSGIPARYELLSQLGTGGTGIVYKVRDVETGELIALKMLKPELASDPAVQENFKRELCLARKVTHKNVCRIYEFSRGEGHAFTTMELVEGESLLSHLHRTGGLPVAEATEIIRQMCAGLREAHSQGVVHRDLKPANIMIDRSGTVKIMDFGIARLIQGNGNMTGTIVGTPAYMSPEQAELKAVSAATDIYAMGLVLYEMVTGIPVFNGDTPIAVALKQIRETPKRPREIVPNLAIPVEQVILKCLQKDPADRFQSVDELDAAIRRAMIVKKVATARFQVGPELRKLSAVTHGSLRNTAERTWKFLAQQKTWQSIAQYRTQPVVILRSAVIVVVLVASTLGHWMHRSDKSISTNYADQTVLASSLPPNSTVVSPMTSNEIDLNDKRDQRKTTLTAMRSSDISDLDDDITDITPTPKVAAKSGSRRIVASTKIAAPPKNIARTPVSPIPVALTAEQPPVPAPLPVNEAAKPLVQTPATTTQIEVSGTPETIDTNDPKDSGKTLCLEVATFKDETWAQNAVDKLTSLGFKAFYIHRTKLWLQSYRVEVGPFANPQDMETIRQNLNSRGIKPKH
jgi:serine/threonine protein kinase/class 3 adenylate cyclase